MTDGSIEAIVGPVFAAKTTEFIRRVREARKDGLIVQVFRPRRDTRPELTTHAGDLIAAQVVSDPFELLAAVHPETQVVGIDEAQFFTTPHEGPLTYELVLMVQRLAYGSPARRVIVSGLDMNYRAEPFGPMPHLLAIATAFDKLTAVCACGARATLSRRVVAETAEVLVGAGEVHRPQCVACYKRPLQPGPREA